MYARSRLVARDGYLLQHARVRSRAVVALASKARQTRTRREAMRGDNNAHMCINFD